MDLNLLLHRHQVALMLQERSADAEERRAYSQFARDYAVQIAMRRTKSGAPDANCGFSA
jgi:hypothetical protein